MRRLLPVLIAFLALVPIASAKPAAQWANDDIRFVTERGLLGGTRPAFVPATRSRAASSLNCSPV